MSIHIVVSRSWGENAMHLNLINADDVKSVERIIQNRGDEVVEIVSTSIPEEGFIEWETVVDIAKDSFRLGRKAVL